jgi:sugar phosphate isomerase/epimerase
MSHKAKKVPVALQIYSVRDYAKEDFRGTMRAVKAMGYDGVELAGFYDQTKHEVRAALEESGLRCVSAHVPLIDMLADIEGVLDDYTYLGCEYIAIPHVGKDRRPNTPGFEPSLKEFDRIGAACAARGVKLLYHNHDFEFERVADGSHALDYMFTRIPPEHLQPELDLCWVKIAGQDPVDYVKKYSGRAPILHYKDYYKDFEGGKLEELLGFGSSGSAPRGRFEFRPLGCGMQHFPPILEATIEAGTEWVIVEQDAPVVFTSMDCAEISRKYLWGLGW